MQLHVINTGYFKLDGGAMFGVVPKSIWNKTNPADANNLCSWALRCLLIEDGNKLILIDVGIGNKQDEKFLSHYFLHGDDSLEKSLHNKGFSRDDITDVFLTHLHFDHCGGGTDWNADKTRIEPAFKNAKYWSNQAHWHWATQPNSREKASFLKENLDPLAQGQQLHFVDPLLPSNAGLGFDVLFTQGHTASMMCPIIKYKNYSIVYMADLLPSIGHIPLPYLMAYDTRPLLTLVEKENFFIQAATEKTILFLEHDPVNECCTILQTERGFKLDQKFPLSDLG